MSPEIVEMTLVGSRFSDIRQGNNFVPRRLCQNRLKTRLVYQYFNQLLLAARKVHFVYLDQLLGAAY